MASLYLLQRDVLESLPLQKHLIPTLPMRFIRHPAPIFAFFAAMDFLRLPKFGRVARNAKPPGKRIHFALPGGYQADCEGRDYSMSSAPLRWEAIYLIPERDADHLETSLPRFPEICL